VEKYKHKWDTKPEEESAKPRPLEEEDANEEVNEDSAAQDIVHLECLVDFMKKYLQEIPALREQIKTRKLETVSFDELWHLYNPGDVILSRAIANKNEQQAYQVLTVTKGRYNMRDGRSDVSRTKGGQRDRNGLQLQCFWLDYDGTKIDTREETLTIKSFVGKKKVVDLDFYPKAYATTKEIEDLQSRAKRFIANRYGHGRADGVTTRFEFEHLDNEEVFVDFKSGYEELPSDWKKEIHNFGLVTVPDCSNDETFEANCSVLGCTSCSNTVYLDEQIDVKRAEAVRESLPKSVPEDKINDLKKSADHLLLLPRHLLVYTLRAKKWRTFALCSILREPEI
jgi:hypothetical protein